MIAVAGHLAYKALSDGKNFFHKLTVYGIGCVYETDSAIVMKLMLDFKKRSSGLIEYDDQR